MLEHQERLETQECLEPRENVELLAIPVTTDVPELTDDQEQREILVSLDKDVQERRETPGEPVSQETQEEEETEETPGKTACLEHLGHLEKREILVLLEHQDVTVLRECPDLRETLHPSQDPLDHPESPEQVSQVHLELREIKVTPVCLELRVTRERRLTTMVPGERTVLLEQLEGPERRVILDSLGLKECLE